MKAENIKNELCNLKLWTKVKEIFLFINYNISPIRNILGVREIKSIFFKIKEKKFFHSQCKDLVQF